jgi:hypothetical protein
MKFIPIPERPVLWVEIIEVKFGKDIEKKIPLSGYRIYLLIRVTFKECNQPIYK